MLGGEQSPAYKIAKLISSMLLLAVMFPTLIFMIAYIYTDHFGIDWTKHEKYGLSLESCNLQEVLDVGGKEKIVTLGRGGSQFKNGRVPNASEIYNQKQEEITQNIRKFESGEYEIIEPNIKKSSLIEIAIFFIILYVFGSAISRKNKD